MSVTTATVSSRLSSIDILKQFVTEYAVWLRATARGIVYDSTIGYFYTQYVMQKVLDQIPEGSRILDIGIGTGYAHYRNQHIIKEKNLVIVGIDIDAEYVKRAKHTMIDAGLDQNVKLIVADVYDVEFDQGFDFVIFSDSYAVIPDVHQMISHCEKFLGENGKVIITSTLFDQYNQYIDWVKQRIGSVSSVEFGEMKLKHTLINYAKQRALDQSDIEIELIDQKTTPIVGYQFNTYVVSWTPKTVMKESDSKCEPNDQDQEFDSMVPGEGSDLPEDIVSSDLSQSPGPGSAPESPISECESESDD